MAKQKQIQAFGFEQKLQDKYWNWSDAEKKQHFTDSKSIMRHICNRLYTGLQNAGATGDELKFEFCGINHDKDMNEINGVFVPIDEHVHGVVTLAKKRDLNVIAQWLGLEPQQVEIPKGRYGKENMLAYLIHAKQPKKHQYLPQEVETFGTFDYVAYYESKKELWEKRKATVQKKDNKESAEWLKSQVQQGLLSIDEIMAHPEHKYVYADNMRLIDDALRFYYMDKGHQTLRDLDSGKFQLSVYFITGESNAGKSYTARVLCKYLQKINGWDWFEASASNPLDDYAAQEVLFLDEVRPYTFDATEWLLMLTNGRQTLKARFYNKIRAYKAIVITSPVEDPYTFFNQVRGQNGELEPLNQFIRRLDGHIHIVFAGEGKRYAYYDKTARSEYSLLYDDNQKKFISDNDTPKLSNGVPLLEEDKYSNYREYRGGPRKVDFGMVPYSEGVAPEGIEDGVSRDTNVESLGNEIMRDILRDVQLNSNPSVKHKGERSSIKRVEGQKKLKDFSTSMGLEYSDSYERNE